MPMPMPTLGLIGALAFLGGGLTVTLVASFFNTRQARGGGGDGTGNNGTRNGTHERGDQGLRDLEDGRVHEGGRENGGGRGQEARKNIMILVVMLAIRVMLTLMMVFKIGSETKITALLQLLLSFGIIVYFLFRMFRR